MSADCCAYGESASGALAGGLPWIFAERGMQMEKMRDEELVKKLEHYERVENFWTLIMLPGIVASGLIGFVGRQVVLGTALFFICLFGCLIVGEKAKKKKKALIREQLQDFFQSELEYAFGPEQHQPEFVIDEAHIRYQGFFQADWEECVIENAYEGVYKGRDFSAANVVLRHVYKVKTGQAEYSRRSVDVFLGLWVIFGTVQNVTGRSCIHGNFISQLEDAVSGELTASAWEENRLVLAISTDHRFADVPETASVHDIDGLRRSFTHSLRGVKELLDVLIRENV